MNICDKHGKYLVFCMDCNLDEIEEQEKQNETSYHWYLFAHSYKSNTNYGFTSVVMARPDQHITQNDINESIINIKNSDSSLANASVTITNISYLGYMTVAKYNSK